MTERRLQRPPPDLQELVRKYGGYSQITDVAWERYDRDLKQWKDDLRNGRLDVEDQ